MGDWPRLVNLRRCARGYVPVSAGDGNTTIALTNNSLGPELILVWQIWEPTPNGGDVFTSYQQIDPMEVVFPAQPIVPGDAQPPGILSGYSQATAYTPDFDLGNAQFSSRWPATFPFAVLQPGWSLCFQNAGGGEDSLGMALWWEAILSEYFDRVHTFRQLELDLILKQGG